MSFTKINLLFFLWLAEVFFITDYKAQSLYFPPNSGNTWDTISPRSLNWCDENIESLYAYLDSNNTKAFILLKDGKIVLEKYFGTHTQNSVWQWASAGKTITSFMVGIAQQENYLSISDTTADYLGNGWTSCTAAQEEKITIRHQLTMSSGLDDAFTDPYCTTPNCLVYKADAGTRWAYHNGPYTLLDGVIAAATGTTLNAYTTQKLKNPTGMTGAFFPVGFNNVFFSNARSMARFGLLILNKGNWNGLQVMSDSNYFNKMVTTSQNMNLSYGYLWWLNGKASYMLPGAQFVFNGPVNPNAPADMIAAMGKDGQFLNVVPSKNMVWIRMGNAPEGLPVPYLLNDGIWQRINALECSSTGLSERQHDRSLEISPNPCNETIFLSAGIPFHTIDVCDSRGQVLIRQLCTSEKESVSLTLLQPGVYFIKAQMQSGEILRAKFLKQ